jgi:hypothetical protein
MQLGQEVGPALVIAGLLNIVLMIGVANTIGYLTFADANNARPDVAMAGLPALPF